MIGKARKPHHELAMDIVHRITLLRRQAKISQRELAKRMYTTQSAISDFEQYKIEPRLSIICAYLEALGYTLKFMIVDETNRDAERIHTS